MLLSNSCGLTTLPLSHATGQSSALEVDDSYKRTCGGSPARLMTGFIFMSCRLKLYSSVITERQFSLPMTFKIYNEAQSQYRTVQTTNDDIDPRSRGYQVCFSLISLPDPCRCTPTAYSYVSLPPRYAAMQVKSRRSASHPSTGHVRLLTVE